MDNKPPRAYMHLIVNSKKVQLEEERKAVIDRDNFLLLQKMSHIMKTGGRIDNVNEYEPLRYINGIDNGQLNPIDLFMKQCEQWVFQNHLPCSSIFTLLRLPQHRAFG